MIQDGRRVMKKRNLWMILTIGTALGIGLNSAYAEDSVVQEDFESGEEVTLSISEETELAEDNIEEIVDSEISMEMTDVKEDEEVLDSDISMDLTEMEEDEEIVDSDISVDMTESEENEEIINSEISTDMTESDDVVIEETETEEAGTVNTWEFADYDKENIEVQIEDIEKQIWLLRFKDTLVGEDNEIDPAYFPKAVNVTRPDASVEMYVITEWEVETDESIWEDEEDNQPYTLYKAVFDPVTGRPGERDIYIKVLSEKTDNELEDDTDDISGETESEMQVETQKADSDLIIEETETESETKVESEKSNDETDNETEEVSDETESEMQTETKMIESKWVEIPDVNYVYSGEEQYPDICVKGYDDQGEIIELEKDVDYEITFYNLETKSSDVIHSGEIEVTVTGKGSYSGEVKGAYHIIPCSISNFEIIVSE